ncbi:MAG: ion transporter, partial [Pseudobutyrivibrio sp.]|nr:ion transporter [Pseudobutyrivibrio sp.]
MLNKVRIFNIIQIGNKDDIPSRLFDIFITLVITINILVMVLETYSDLSSYFPILDAIALITIVIFCIEYGLRIWTSDLLYPHLSKSKAIVKFLCSFDGVVDLLTILPFFFLSGFVAFRILRIIRIFHLFRINGQYDSFAIIFSVLHEKKNQILSSVIIVLILMLSSSIGIYYAEHEAQPTVFRNAFSGIWWSVSTLLTVGYGDIYPVTVTGRIMAIATAFFGVGAVAIPTGIISAGFVEHYSRVNMLNNFA